MRILVNSKVPGLDGKNLTYQGVEITVGAILQTALMETKLQTANEKRAIYQTVKLIREAANSVGYIVMPSKESLIIYMDHIWDFWPLSIAGPTEDCINLMLETAEAADLEA